MATRKIVSKHIAHPASSYVGRKGELILDTVTNELKISDGSTAGGTILNTDGSSGGGGASTGNYTFSGNVISNGSFPTITASSAHHLFSSSVIAATNVQAGGTTGKAQLTSAGLFLGLGTNGESDSSNRIQFAANTNEGGDVMIYARRPNGTKGDMEFWFPNHATSTGTNTRYIVTTAVDGGSSGDSAGLTGNFDTAFGDITFNGNTLSTGSSNADLELDASGTGLIKVKAHITPISDQGASLGSTSLRFFEGHLSSYMEVGASSGTRTRLDSGNLNFTGSTYGGQISFNGDAYAGINVAYNSTFRSAFGNNFIIRTGPGKDFVLTAEDGVGGSAESAIRVAASDTTVTLGTAGTGAVTMLPTVINMANLPTSDPTSAGQLWNDGGALKISAG